jgi:putative membrane protein
MTNKSNIISRLGIVLFCFCCVVSAFAQYNQPGFGPRTASSLPATRTEAPLPATRSNPTAAPSRGSKLSAKDKAFMLDAGKGGQLEVTWGQWAAQKAQSTDVKKFGNRMVTDHSKWTNELMALAKEEGVTIPAAKPNGKWKSDKDYMNFMVKDHQEDLAAFQSEAQNGSDPDLKKWADKTAKGVKKHLDMAKEVQSKLK